MDGESGKVIACRAEPVMATRPAMTADGNCHGVTKVKGLYIFRCRRARQLPNRRRAVGGGKPAIRGFVGTKAAERLYISGLSFLDMEKGRKNGFFGVPTRLSGR